MIEEYFKLNGYNIRANMVEIMKLETQEWFRKNYYKNLKSENKEI